MRTERLACISRSTSKEETRKALGIFYTDGACAELLAQLTIRDAHARTLDLACGDGRLLSAAYRTKIALLAATASDMERGVQSQLLEDLFGIDIVASAARRAALRLVLEAAPPTYRPLNITVSNSTNLVPGRILPSLDLRPARNSGKRWREFDKQGLFRLEPVDVVLMNPPFTRQERLTKKFKRSLRSLFACYSEYDSGRLGLYGYFVFLADMFLKKGGRIGMVLPASFLRLQSTIGLRRLFCENYDLEYLVAKSERSAFSQSSCFREIMLVATKRRSIGEAERPRSSERPSCFIVHIARDPKTPEDAREIAERIHRVNIRRDPGVFVRKISQASLHVALDNLFTVVSAADKSIDLTWLNVKSRHSDKLRRLGCYLQESHGRICRGLETRRDIGIQVQKAFILRSEARGRGLRNEWALKAKKPNFLVCSNRGTQDTIKVRLSSLRPGLRRLSGLRHIDAGGETDWVFFSTFPEPLGDIQVQAHTIKKRLRSYVRERAGTFVLARRFGLCRPGTRLVAFYCRHPVVPSGLMWSLRNLRSRDAKVLALWFNSSPGLLELLLNRVETSEAWMQLHRYVVEDLFVLDPRRLSAAQTKLLLATFNRLRKVDFPSFREQFSSNFQPRLALDSAVLRCMGLDKKEAAIVGQQTRLAIMRELENLSRINLGDRLHAKLSRLRGVEV